MQSPTDFDSGAVFRLLMRAAYAKSGSSLSLMFRNLGARTVPDIGSQDEPVTLPGCCNTYWRQDGFWFDIGWAMDGSGRKVAHRVTDPKRQNELDMCADAEHPLWKEI